MDIAHHLGVYSLLFRDVPIPILDRDREADPDIFKRSGWIGFAFFPGRSLPVYFISRKKSQTNAAALLRLSSLSPLRLLTSLTQLRATFRHAPLQHHACHCGPVHWTCWRNLFMSRTCTRDSVTLGSLNYILAPLLTLHYSRKRSSERSIHWETV